jgi:hypothetical protein
VAFNVRELFAQPWEIEIDEVPAFGVPEQAAGGDQE